MTFVECPVGAKNTKARSYKLGELYSPESIKYDSVKRDLAEASYGAERLQTMYLTLN